MRTASYTCCTRVKTRLGRLILRCWTFLTCPAIDHTFPKPVAFPLMFPFLFKLGARCLFESFEVAGWPLGLEVGGLDRDSRQVFLLSNTFWHLYHFLCIHQCQYKLSLNERATVVICQLIDQISSFCERQSVFLVERLLNKARCLRFFSTRACRLSS